MEKRKKIYKWMVPFALLVLPVMVIGQLLPAPTNPIEVNETPTLSRFEELITDVAQFLITVSVVIAVIMIIIGGIMFMFARGNEDAIGKAKKTVLNGIIGAVLVLGVGLILQFFSNLVQGNFF